MEIARQLSLKYPAMINREPCVSAGLDPEAKYNILARSRDDPSSRAVIKRFSSTSAGSGSKAFRRLRKSVESWPERVKRPPSYRPLGRQVPGGQVASHMLREPHSIPIDQK